MYALKCDDKKLYTFHKVYRKDNTFEIIRVPVEYPTASAFLAEQHGDFNFRLITNASSEDIALWAESHEDVKIVGLVQI